MLGYFVYICGGCLHTTIIDKDEKAKGVHCASCGVKAEMQKMGECSVRLVNQPEVFKPIH